MRRLKINLIYIYNYVLLNKIKGNKIFYWKIVHGHFKFFLREQVKGYKTYEHKKEKKKRRMNEKYRKEKKKTKTYGITGKKK